MKFCKEGLPLLLVVIFAAANIWSWRTPIPSHFNTQGRLVIYVSSWEEGISSWRKSLAEIMVVTWRLNATLVETCITQGRLVSCGELKSHTAAVKLGDVCNMTGMKEYRPSTSSRGTSFLTKPRCGTKMAHHLYALWEPKRCLWQFAKL